MNVLGISGLYHDSAACLIIDGNIVAAAQNERFSRIKHDLNFPIQAIEYCLREGSISADELDIVVFYDNPILTLDRFIKNVYDSGIESKELINGLESLVTSKVWIHREIKKLLSLNKKTKILVCDHHVSHAASAFYPSPYERAVIITIDGVGEWATMTIGKGDKKELKIMEEIRYPHSLGLFYSAFTWFCGFKVNSGDYKFMGLAPYGEPIYENLIRKNIIDIKDDGSFRLNLDYFDYQNGRTMTNKKMEELFGGPRREAESKITKREMDIAASVQRIVEDVIIKIARHAKSKYGQDTDNLVLAGGVALNCVANGKLKNANIFKNIWIQPAAGDAGGSLGCALYAAYQHGENRIINPTDSQKGSYLGNSYSNDEVKKFLDAKGYKYHFFGEDEIFSKIADMLMEEMVIGLFQGRMEFGPRALGNRSIIADARSEDMQVKLNQKIKFRESFRPFAPAVLEEDVQKYFELNDISPYMLLVENVVEYRRNRMDLAHDLKEYEEDMLEIVRKKRSDIPAVTHVDYSARIQTVNAEKNRYFYNVIKAFKDKTKCSMVVNTSFNVRGEPIVCTLQNAYDCFMRTDMDILVLENFVLYKSEQPEWVETEDWKSKYTLD